MNEPLTASLILHVRNLDQEIRRRDGLVTCAYSAAILMAVGLFEFFPFDLSRIGSVVLAVAFGYMIWKFYEARRISRAAREGPGQPPLSRELAKVKAQVKLCQSVLFNLPFVVGANLFWMGLPGTGSAVLKAQLDCVFLAGSVLVFTSLYFFNQRNLRRELIPLQEALEKLAARSQKLEVRSERILAPDF